MNDLDTFRLSPRGKVKVSYSWQPSKTDFMSGRQQIRRRRINAKKSYSFTVSGSRKDYDYLVKFYNDHFGQLKPFIFEYDGNREEVYFGSALSVKVIREVGTVVGFSASLTLNIDSRGKVEKITPTEQDELPCSRAEVTYSSDWNTKVDNKNTTRRRKEYEKPREKLLAKFNGSKKTRDRVIKLFESHASMPLLFPFDGKKVKVRFPDNLEVTDIREAKQIVGFECQIELEVINDS